MKRKILATVIILCMAFAACFALVACAPDEQKAASFVSLDINPSIELTLDSHDKVLSVRGANEDGQVLPLWKKSPSWLSSTAIWTRTTRWCKQA